MDRIAVVDIGTNTLLLLVVERGTGGELVRIHDECRFGRLGQGLDNSGRLHPDAVARSIEIARTYRAEIDRLGASRVAVVGTQALREATNASEFVGPAEAIFGTNIDIIAGEREAQLVARAVSASFPELAGTDYAIADVGGGSTEVIVCSQGQVVSFVSVAIGSVRFKERYLLSDPPTEDEAHALITAVDAAITSLDLPTGVPLIGTAGTATSIASVELQLRSYDPDRIHGTRIAPAIVERQLARHLELTIAERVALPGLEPERADVIPAGVAIYAGLLSEMRAPYLIVSDRGVRWGLAYELAETAQ